MLRALAQGFAEHALLAYLLLSAVTIVLVTALGGLFHFFRGAGRPGL